MIYGIFINIFEWNFETGSDFIGNKLRKYRIRILWMPSNIFLGSQTPQLDTYLGLR